MGLFHKEIVSLSVGSRKLFFRGKVVAWRTSRIKPHYQGSLRYLNFTVFCFYKCLI